MKNSLDAIVKADKRARLKIEQAKKLMDERSHSAQADKEKLEKQLDAKVQAEIEQMENEQKKRVGELEEALVSQEKRAQEASRTFIATKKDEYAQAMFERLTAGQ